MYDWDAVGSEMMPLEVWKTSKSYGIATLYWPLVSEFEINVTKKLLRAGVHTGGVHTQPHRIPLRLMYSPLR